MRTLLFCCLTLVLFSQCKKEHRSRVDIYLLKSFTSTVSQATNPATVSISNAILEDAPLVADEDILFYKRSNTTFIIKKDIQPQVKNLGPDKGFAVTVDGRAVYYGKFHPMYLSSIVLGTATITPETANNGVLKIDFVNLDGNPTLQQLDKRNESSILSALRPRRTLH